MARQDGGEGAAGLRPHGARSAVGHQAGRRGRRPPPEQSALPQPLLGQGYSGIHQRQQLFERPLYICTCWKKCAEAGMGGVAHAHAGQHGGDAGQAAGMCTRKKKKKTCAPHASRSTTPSVRDIARQVRGPASSASTFPLSSSAATAAAGRRGGGSGGGQRGRRERRRRGRARRGRRRERRRRTQQKEWHGEERRAVSERQVLYLLRSLVGVIQQRASSAEGEVVRVGGQGAAEDRGQDAGQACDIHKQLLLGMEKTARALYTAAQSSGIMLRRAPSPIKKVAVACGRESSVRSCKPASAHAAGEPGGPRSWPARTEEP